MTVDQQAILKRIRRKAEIMMLDLRATNNMKHHDAKEILLLIDLMEQS